MKIKTLNCNEEAFVIKINKNTVPWTYVIEDLNREEIAGTYYEEELQKLDQTEFTVEKVIKRKGGKLYVKWNSFSPIQDGVGVQKKTLPVFSYNFYKRWN